MRLLIVVFLLLNSINIFAQKQEKIIRIAEIEIDTNYTSEYQKLLKEEAKASVIVEPGVEAIVPLFDKNDPSKIKILEIYSNKEAYEKHIKTSHFLKYKTETLHMIKSLKLIDMISIDPESLTIIFNKTEP